MAPSRTDQLRGRTLHWADAYCVLCGDECVRNSSMAAWSGTHTGSGTSTLRKRYQNSSNVACKLMRNFESMAEAALNDAIHLASVRFVLGTKCCDA
eukprot:5242643-Pleurochrysis_carterae.AAC.1